MPPELNMATEVAVLKNELAHVRSDIGDLEGRIDKLSGKIDHIADTLSQAKGGWKAILAAGAIGGAIVGFLSKALPLLIGR